MLRRQQIGLGNGLRTASNERWRTAIFRTVLAICILGGPTNAEERFGMFGPCEYALGSITEYVNAFEQLGWRQLKRGDTDYLRTASAVGEIAWVLRTLQGPFEDAEEEEQWLLQAHQYGDSVANFGSNALLQSNTKGLLIITTGLSSDRSVSCLIASSEPLTAELARLKPGKPGLPFSMVSDSELPTPHRHFDVTLLRVMAREFQQDLAGGYGLISRLSYSDTAIEGWGEQ